VRSWVVLEGCQTSVLVHLPWEQTTVTMSLVQLREITEPFLILQILVPVWKDPPPNASEFFASDRVAQRLHNAHPLVNGQHTTRSKMAAGRSRPSRSGSLAELTRSCLLLIVCACA